MYNFFCRVYCSVFGHDHRYRDLWRVHGTELTRWSCANCNKWFSTNTEE